MELTIPKHMPVPLGHCSLVYPDTLSDGATAGFGLLHEDEETLLLSALCTWLKAVEGDRAVILVMS